MRGSKMGRRVQQSGSIPKIAKIVERIKVFFHQNRAKGDTSNKFCILIAKGMLFNFLNVATFMHITTYIWIRAYKFGPKSF